MYIKHYGSKLDVKIVVFTIPKSFKHLIITIPISTFLLYPNVIMLTIP